MWYQQLKVTTQQSCRNKLLWAFLKKSLRCTKETFMKLIQIMIRSKTIIRIATRIYEIIYQHIPILRNYITVPIALTRCTSRQFTSLRWWIDKTKVRLNLAKSEQRIRNLCEEKNHNFEWFQKFITEHFIKLSYHNFIRVPTYWLLITTGTNSPQAKMH